MKVEPTEYQTRFGVEDKDRNPNYLDWATGKMALSITEVGKVSADGGGLVEAGIESIDDMPGLMACDTHMVDIMKFHSEMDLGLT